MLASTTTRRLVQSAEEYAKYNINIKEYNNDIGRRDKDMQAFACS